MSFSIAMEESLISSSKARAIGNINSTALRYKFGALSSIRTRCLAAAVCLCLCFSFASLFLMPSTETSLPKVCDCEKDCHGSGASGNGALKDESVDNHKLSLIVPFRDRFDELMEFVPYMSLFLKNQGIAFEIIIINQVDSHRFNRAALINVGYLLSDVNSDYIAMHDVDLMPLNHNLSYAYPGLGPYHVAAPGLHPLYSYKTFVGGILLVAKKHFRQVNGLSNLFWGWGREDDDFYLRLKAANISIARPDIKSVTTGRKNTFRHFHGPTRQRDQIRYDKQKGLSRHMDVTTGLNNVAFEVIKTQQLSIEGYKAFVHHVILDCNYDKTPWCDHLLSEEEIAAVLARQKRERAERRRKKAEKLQKEQIFDQ